MFGQIFSDFDICTKLVKVLERRVVKAFQELWKISLAVACFYLASLYEAYAASAL